jgi:4-alpha-glucanotransferase
LIREGEKSRVLNLSQINQDHVIVIDTWNHAGEYENAFFTTPFKEVFFSEKPVLKVKKESSLPIYSK